MGSPVVSARAQLAQLLCDPNFSLSQIPKKGLRTERSIMALSTEILGIFGVRFASALKTAIQDPDVKKGFVKTWAVCTRIQNGLHQGRHYCSLREFQEKTGIPIHVPAAISEADYLAQLRRDSYVIHGFFQQARSYPNADHSRLEELESRRERALQHITHRLNETVPNAPRFKPEDEVDVAGCYFAPALLYGEESVYFHELIRQWQRLAGQNQGKVDALMRCLPLCSLVETPDPLNKPILMTFLKNGQDQPPFRTYLVRCSIEAVKRNLGIEFSTHLEKYCQDPFLTEAIRSDVCYFSAHLEELYRLELPNRSSKQFLLALQLFAFFQRTQGVRTDRHAPLLEMLVHRNPGWRIPNWPEFQNRNWQDPVPEQEREAFTAAWEGLMRLLHIVKQKNSDSLPLTDPWCWPLFFLLWQNERRELFIGLFSQLAKVPGFVFSLKDLYRFCEVNRNVSAEDLNTFRDTYLRILEKYNEEQGKALPHPERLFLSPPIDLNAEYSTLPMMRSAPNTVLFIQLMAPYAFPQGGEYVDLLRHLLLKESFFLFAFLEGAPISNKKDPTLLARVLVADHERFESSHGERARARAMVLKLHEQFEFTDEQLFHLFVEFTRLMMEGKEGCLGVISEAVTEWEKFCPALGREEVYFLFRYHPDIDIQAVRALLEKRFAWARNEAQLGSVHLNPAMYTEIIDAINQLIEPLGGACPNEEERERFISKFRQALLSAFFPPLQPLADYFRISNITPKGIDWRAAVFKTHWGQWKPIQNRASLGVYFNWTVVENKPTLFFSFYNIRTGTAHSASIPLPVSIEELAPPEKRRPFYALLHSLSQLLLGEESDGSGVQEEVGHYKEDIEAGNLTADQIESMQKFLGQVKVAYRNLFLCASAGRRLPLLPLESPLELAGLGHVFDSHDRGSLLPESLLRLYSPEGFVPDAPLEQLDPAKFKVRANGHETEALGLSLKVVGENGIIQFPIYYHVQSAQELIGNAAEDERAPRAEERQGSYVTLSAHDFQIPLRYPPEALENPELFLCFFDFHNLLLKAHLYYVRSQQME